MNKKITIYDYARNPVEIDIPNFENVIKIICRVVSGDEILDVYYKVGEKNFDSCPGGRLHGYFDGQVDIPLSRLDELSSIPDSYDMLERFGDENARERIGFEAIGDLIELAKESVEKGELH